MIKRIQQLALMDNEDQLMLELVLSICIICVLIISVIPAFTRFLILAQLTESHLFSSLLRADYHIEYAQGVRSDRSPHIPLINLELANPLPPTIKQLEYTNNQQFFVEFHAASLSNATAQVNWLLQPQEQATSTPRRDDSPKAYQWLGWRCQIQFNSTDRRMVQHIEITTEIAFSSAILCPI